MKNLDLYSKYISDGIWQVLFEATYPHSFSRKQSLFELFHEMEPLKKCSENPTGSTSLSSCWNLYSIIRYFNITRVIEIGTYIGRSTMAMAYAMDDHYAEQQGTIYTCDNTNKIELPQKTRTEIVQYPFTKSTDMFRSLKKLNIPKCEMAYIDGLLVEEDIPLLKELLEEHAVIVLDDLDGCRKGTFNIVKIAQSELFSKHFLIHSPSKALLDKFDLKDHSTTAFLIHANLINLNS